MPTDALLLAGIPANNPSLYHRVRFLVHDPAAYLNWRDDAGQSHTTFILRDIEMGRARQHARADRIACPADLVPPDVISGDRETATAQAAAAALRAAGIERVRVDRSLPFIFAHHLQEAGVTPVYDPALGIGERRAKSDEEIDKLRKAQRITEQVMTLACETIASADAAADGTLMHDGAPLTSERMRRMITLACLDRGCTTPSDSIVATTPHSADCHHFGTGPLRTGEPVIVDIFPRDESTRYHGDCTRTVVHGTPRDPVLRMHAAVLDAKARALAALKPGVTGEAVHHTTVRALAEHGYRWCSPTDPRPPRDDEPVMPHGTGHGIGLEIHEPILLADGGEAIVPGEVFTIEPGLYCVAFGGVRVEDMAVATPRGGENLNTLHEGLSWR